MATLACRLGPVIEGVLDDEYLAILAAKYWSLLVKTSTIRIDILERFFRP